jgi:hypothetical protein
VAAFCQVTVRFVSLILTLLLVSPTAENVSYFVVRTHHPVFTIFDVSRPASIAIVALAMDAAGIAQAEKLIPAEVRMISGCRDEQTSADGAWVLFEFSN